MPEIKSPKKKKEPSASKAKHNEVVSAYSEEGKRRNESTRRLNLTFTIVGGVLAAALFGALIFVLIFGSNNGWFA
ncbi:MAG: hypothetical protein K6E59_05290 [Bacilli bacterium]|nr:hypothetical protein [Bacilli bacterium]